LRLIVVETMSVQRRSRVHVVKMSRVAKLHTRVRGNRQTHRTNNPTA